MIIHIRYRIVSLFDRNQRRIGKIMFCLGPQDNIAGFIVRFDSHSDIGKISAAYVFCIHQIGKINILLAFQHRAVFNGNFSRA